MTWVTQGVCVADAENPANAADAEDPAGEESC